MALTHARTARQLLDIADREFARSNIGLTSEILWAAASHALKAVCVNRSWPLPTQTGASMGHEQAKQLARRGGLPLR